jgi:hypothetical protein
MPEIIPREYKEKSFDFSFLSLLAVILFLASFLSYFLFYFLTSSSEKKIRELEQKREESKTQEQLKLEEEIKLYRRKLKDVEILLKEHSFSSRFFELLEKTVHPQIVFKKSSLDTISQKAILEGLADNFYVLGQQIMIFEKEPLISKTHLSNLTISNDGKVNFSLEILFNPQFLKR